MQEEVENKTVNLAVSTIKPTARVLIRGIRWYLMHRNQKKLRKQLAHQNDPIGEQSVEKLLKGGAGTDKIELPDGSAKEFCKIAKQFGVDYAIRKDKTADPPRYGRGGKNEQEKDAFTPNEMSFAIGCGAKKYVDYAEAMKLFGLGRNKIIEIAKDANAIRDVKGRKLVNVQAVEDYIELMFGQNSKKDKK